MRRTPSSRRDLAVFNEATGFLITSESLRDHGLRAGMSKWKDAVLRGDLLPIALVQDDDFVIRVVVGGTLNARENAEWVGRVCSTLRVPDGRLVVSGGAGFVMKARDGKTRGASERVHILDVPPGDYRADLYAYLHGVNGERLLEAASGRKKETIGAYHRRTRGGRRFPLWLQQLCSAYPETDPGHEDYWDEHYVSGDEGPEWVDFLLHLTPRKGKRVASKSRKGWFSLEAFEARKPTLCPAGLEAKKPLRHEATRRMPDSSNKKVLEPLEEVHARASRYPLAPVKGGPVAISLERLADVARLGAFTSFLAVPELRVTAPSGGTLTTPTLRVDEGRVEAVAGGWRIAFLQDRLFQKIETLRKILPRLGPIPEGSVVDLTTADIQSAGPPIGVRPPGVLRFVGEVSGGRLRITHAFPPVDAARLEDAVALAAQSDRGQALVLRDNDEAVRTREAFLAEWDGDVAPEHLRVSGASLRVDKSKAGHLYRLAKAVFRARYADTWTIRDDDDDPR